MHLNKLKWNYSSKYFEDKPFIKRVFLYGSYAQGTASSNSDIDLLVDLNYDELTDKTLEFLSMSSELSHHFSIKISIATIASFSEKLLPKKIDMNTLDERKSKSFDVVLDTVKLLITLNAAIIGYIVSAILIHKDPKDDTLDVLRRHSCATEWSLYFFAGSMLFALMTILKITGMPGDPKTTDAKVTIYDTATRYLFSFCLLSFLIGVIIIGRVGLKELS